MISGDQNTAGNRVLVLLPESPEAYELCERITHMGVEVCLMESPEEARERLHRGDVSVALCHRRLGDGDGIDFLSLVRDQFPQVRRVLVSQASDRGSVGEAVNRAGIHYWIDPLCRGEELRSALDLGRDPRRPARPSARRGSFSRIIGESAPMIHLLEMVDRVARTASSVLVTGETGTGKELVGQAIHEASNRRSMPFAAVNSAAIPETLLESELFGHRRGSFTGATSDNTGLFEGADGGTVFLDEVGEMPLSMQAKLLRFLQTGEVRPVGSQCVTHVDVRLVAATNRRLEEEVEKGNFREDLYYRLAVIPLHVPPLRQRMEDVPLLAEHFVRELAGRSGRPGLRLSREALDALSSHDWPGNVRELENVIEHGAALAEGDRIGLGDLPHLEVRRTASARPSGLESLSSVERKHILETLEQVGWNRKRAARVLEISTTTLWRRLKEFGIEQQSGRGPLLSSDQ